MTNDFSGQSISIKNQYAALLNTLFKKYEDLVRYDLIHPTQNSLKEIQQLLQINDENFRLSFDEQLKAKMRAHIMFIKGLTQTIDMILEEEAIHEHTEHLKQTEAILRFEELDKKEVEQRRNAFEHVRIMMEQEREFALYSMLSMNLDILDTTIENLKTTRSEIHSHILRAESLFYTQLRDKFKESNLFHHLNDDQMQELHKQLEVICNEVDLKYSLKQLNVQAAKGNNQRQILSFGVQPPHTNEHEVARALKKNKKVLKFLRKNHERTLNKEKGSASLSDLTKLDKMANEAIKIHQQYAEEKRKLEKKIKVIDSKIEREESKKQHCLDKADQIIEPRKRDRFKKTIEKTYDKLEHKYYKEKEKLTKMKDEKEICDTAIVSAHPEVLIAPPKTSSKDESILPAAVATKLHQVKGILPGQHKWKSQLSPKQSDILGISQDKKALQGKPKSKDK